jgi:integrase
MDRAKGALGQKLVRRVTVDDVHDLLVGMKADGLSDSTRAKHLRVLGACFASAAESGYCGTNPVRRLPRDARPKPIKKESAYFESDEVARLFAALDAGTYRVLFLTALKTGMRLGELCGLTWADVDLAEAVIRVRRSFTDGEIGPTKSGERRDVDLTDELVELLGEWWGELGRPEDDRLVFPGPTRSGYLNPKHTAAALYGGMAGAEVPRIGPTGEKRTFHSFRHTHAKTALEAGLSITWISKRLGHASIGITLSVYGHFERAARREQAAKLAGAFSV